MRTFLNGILSFIGSESLTDAEYAALPEGLVEAYDRANYEALKTVVQNREAVSGQLKRLSEFFKAKGVDLTGVPSRDAKSHIFIGGAL